MNSELNDDVFLARWLNGELSEEELAKFEQSADFKQYQKIVLGTEALSGPDFDESALFESVKDKRRLHLEEPKKEGKQILFGTWGYAAAAVITLLVVFFLFTYTGNSLHKSDFGEQLSIALPDQSKVILNAKAQVTYNENDWENGRSLDLKGEAYFKVSKGSKFSVNTPKGTVSVLGTQFNVRTMDGLLEVTCYEGKVSVTQQNKTHILTAGKTFRQLENGAARLGDVKELNPGWINNESSFDSLPLKYVLKSIENQYGIQIEGKDSIDDSIIFTGTFPHGDLNLALKTVLNSLDLTYTLKDEKTVSISG